MLSASHVSFENSTAIKLSTAVGMQQSCAHFAKRKIENMNRIF